jgi:hypothetical protein
MMCGNPERGALMDVGNWLRSLGLERYEVDLACSRVDNAPRLAEPQLSRTPECGLLSRRSRIGLADTLWRQQVEEICNG